MERKKEGREKKRRAPQAASGLRARRRAIKFKPGLLQSRVGGGKRKVRKKNRACKIEGEESMIRERKKPAPCRMQNTLHPKPNCAGKKIVLSDREQLP